MDEAYEMADDDATQSSELPVDANATDAAESDAEQAPAQAALVKAIISEIRKDKHHHKDAFGRMRLSQHMAFHGHDKDWSATHYKANIVGQHVKQKTAAIYAKNPRVVARTSERMDFAVWDESAESLKAAMLLVQQAAAVAAQPPMVNELGEPVVTPLPPGLAEAQALIQDFQEGLARRSALRKLGKTLEIVFANAMRQQVPVDFKKGMKHTVRRACTSVVGFVELGFQREYGIAPDVASKLDDFRARIAHIERLRREVAEGKVEEYDAEYAELQEALAALEQQPQIILRSGLTFDFIESTKIIPDRFTKSLDGFVGARHLSVEYQYTKKQVLEIFQHDLGQQYTPYTLDGKRGNGVAGVDFGESEQGELPLTGKSGDDDLVCVWKYYDKAAGLVYYVCDGHPKFLQEPKAPDVLVPRFWPLYALTFNEVENEDELYPKSDVELLADQQHEVNRSRQGKREHREAARPRWGYAKGTLDEAEDIPNLSKAKAFDVIAINMDNQQKIADILQPIPVPGVDPNLYDTGEVMQDATLTVGAQPAQLGGVSKATATEAAIADSSSSSVDSSSIDDLDSFLTEIARDGGQVLLTNMTKEDVVRIAGPGAVWVDDIGMTPEDVFEEVFLQIEAGSTGRPNQAAEIRNMKEIGPLLLQVGSIAPDWLAKEFLRRWDDRLDYTEAVASGLPAIVAQNRMAQPMGGDPASDPNQQGGEGGDKTSAPPEAAGTGPGFGNNQV